MQNFDYARDAFRYIIKKYSIKEIYIPYYLCDVMRHVAFEEGCKPLFYHIDDDFMPEIDFPKEAYILYPNYFGICDRIVEKLVSIYPKLIVDNAHAYYAKPQGFATIYSLHKFKGINKDARLEFDRLHSKYALKNQLNIDLKEDSVPFCYPYLAATIEEADAFAKRLQEEGKIIYRYWNPLPKSFNEYKFYSRLVPIPLISFWWE